MKFFQSASVLLSLFLSPLAGGVETKPKLRTTFHELGTETTIGQTDDSNANQEPKLRTTSQWGKDRFAGVKSEESLRFDGRVVNGIVLWYNRYYHPEISGPVVFLMSGRGTKRSQVTDIGKELASRGYIAITFSHFSESTKDRDANVVGPPNPRYPIDMYKTMKHSMDDIEWMIENHGGAFVKGLPYPSYVLKFAVAGVSMGGHAAQLTFANNKNTIDALVCFVCEGNYEHYMAEKFISLGYQDKDSSPVWDDWFPQELVNLVKVLDPINHFADFNNRPFLAINDYKDPQVPAIVNYEMIKSLRDKGYYSGSNHTKLHHEIADSNEGHDAHKRTYLQKFAVNWLEEHFPVNKQSGVLSAGKYKIVVSDDIKSSYTVRQPFLYSSGSGWLRAAGWLVDKSMIDVDHIWDVSSFQGGYSIKTKNGFICADPSGHYTKNMVGVGEKDWYFTPIKKKFSDLCIWRITEVAEIPGSYQIINDRKNGKLLLSDIPQDYLGYTGYKLFTIPGHTQPGHTQVLGEWENDLFTFHALNNNDISK